MRNNPIILQIGLTAYEPAWEMLLRQIGIAWKVVSERDSLLDNYSVIIVNSETDSVLLHSINDFVQQGGSALYTTNAAKGIKERSTSTSFVTSLPPVENNIYRFFNILDLYSHVTYFHNNDFVETLQYGEGWKVFFGIGVEIILSNGTKRKNFYKRTGRMPNEMVSKQSKGSLRQLIFSLLNTLHHLQQIPFVHQWYYPESEPTVFTMRIDSDKGSQAQIEKIYQISHAHNIPTTWFLDVKSHESWLSYFQNFGAQEIGVHCFEHILYRSSLLNRDNFEKALFLLRKNKIEPKGITAPTGGWNKEYAQAIESLGFRYSSEFAYDYDDLPSFPFINGKFFPLPQIPIHPVCIGTMLRARMNDDEMISYFRSIIDSNYLLNEPICLYHHPTHEHNGVFEEVFRYINDRRIAKLSFTQYADWWNYRLSNLDLLRFANGQIQSMSGNSNTNYRIIQTDNSESIITINDKIDLNNVSFQQVKRELPTTDNIMRSRSFDHRHILQNALDWWIKTTE